MSYRRHSRAANALRLLQVCLVHKLELDDITTTKYRKRTTKRMKGILADAQAAPSATARAEILKNNGLHNVEVRHARRRLSVVD